MSGGARLDETIEDPLGWLDALAAERAGTRWMSEMELCVADPDIARTMLRDETRTLVQHSDFFGPIAQAIGPRAAQVDLARACLARIQAHAELMDVDAAVAGLPDRGEWPRAANLLVLELMRPVLAAPSRSGAFQAALDRLVERRILGRYRRPDGKIHRMVDRFRLANVVMREVERTAKGDAEDDILSIIAAPDRGIAPEQLLHLYVAFVFALVSSIGLSLAWAIYLAADRDRADAPARDIVREALRLYPIAWLLERRPASEQAIGGEAVRPDQAIMISTYAVHRCPAAWPEPRSFRPERWAGRVDHRAWIPFGAGHQSCVAAAFSVKLLTRIVETVLVRPATIEPIDDAPSIGPALAPPRFTLVRGQAPSSRPT